MTSGSALGSETRYIAWACSLLFLVSGVQAVSMGHTDGLLGGGIILLGGTFCLPPVRAVLLGRHGVSPHPLVVATVVLFVVSTGTTIAWN